jgi:hypothetical protein
MMGIGDMWRILPRVFGRLFSVDRVRRDKVRKGFFKRL